MPVVSVITSLSMDHMNLLGNSIEQIAFEKAGVIKRHVPVVSAPQTPEAMEVIRRVARMRGAPLTVAPRVNSLVVDQSRLQADTIYQTPSEFGAKGQYPHYPFSARIASSPT
jgi:dihydrofolate synthase/folylpolyglutamate synthase